MIRPMMAAVLALTVLSGLVLGGAAPALAGPCFDRCMTRCHLPMGYRICRNRCFDVCDRRRTSKAGLARQSLLAASGHQPFQP